MVEWRRTLRSWPEESPRVMDVATAPAWTRDPERLREARRDTFHGLAFVLAAILVPSAIAFQLGHRFAPSGTGPLAAAIYLPGMVSILGAIFASAKWAGASIAARQRRRTLDRLEARGEATLGGEFVGVAYEDRLWRHPTLGDDADHGVLTMGLDRLSFVGRDSRFEIPAREVLATEIRRFDQAIAGPLPRLYVTYRAEGGPETLSVALPYRRSLRRRVGEIDDLQRRLDAWRGDPLPSARVRTLVERPRGDGKKPTQSKHQRIGRPAKMIATFATLSLAVCVNASLVIALTLLGHGEWGGRLGIFFGLWPVVWLLLAAKIEPLLPERWRYRDSKTLPDLQSLGEPHAVEEAERVSIGQKSDL